MLSMSDGGRGRRRRAPRVRRRPAADVGGARRCLRRRSDPRRSALDGRPAGGRIGIEARVDRAAGARRRRPCRASHAPVVSAARARVVDDRRSSSCEVGAARDQQLHHVERGPATPRRSSGVRPCVLSFAFTSAPRVEQRLHRVDVAGLGREVERLDAGRRDGADLAAGVEQPRDHRRRARASWRGAAACRRRPASAARARPPASSSTSMVMRSPLSGGPVQRGHAVGLGGVDVGAALAAGPARRRGRRACAASATGDSARRRAGATPRPAADDRHADDQHERGVCRVASHVLAPAIRRPCCRAP